MPLLVEPPFRNVSARTFFVLQSRDEWCYSMRRDAAVLSGTLKAFVASLPQDQVTVLPLPQISGKALGMCIDYMERKVDTFNAGNLSGLSASMWPHVADWEKQFLLTEALAADVASGSNGQLKLLLYSAEALEIQTLIRLLELYIEHVVSSAPSSEAAIQKFGLGESVRFSAEEEALLATLEYKP